MVIKSWSLLTRYLHLGLVLTVSIQLFISLVMVAPDDKGSSVAKLAFEIHEFIGLTALTIVLSHWVWSIISHTDGGLRHLFPWFGKARLAVINDSKALLKGRLPASGNRGGLPGLVHGLGLLVVSAMAITGGILFFIFPESGEPGYIPQFFAETHEVIAIFVWVYWLGHGGLAIWHHLQGSNIVRKMFSFTNKSKSAMESSETLLHVDINPNK